MRKDGVVVVGLGLSWWQRRGSDDKPRVNVALPASFTSQALEGRTLFEANCMICHGQNAAGTKTGPPLVHIIYEPGHHADVAFQRAARFGVQAHHWRYGNMPPISAVNQAGVEKIVAYVRELQRANGIK